MGEKRMTLEEISKEINISRTTIYKVLNNKGFVADNTKNRVMSTLQKYNYVQNKNARNLALNRSYTVAYVGFKSKSAVYFSKIIHLGLNRARNDFADHGLKLVVREVDIDNPQKQLDEIDVLIKQGVRNFIIAPCDVDAISEKVYEMKKNDCKIIILSRDIISDDYDCYVGIDYFRSGLLAAEVIGKILKKGNLQILVGDEIYTNRDIECRYNGFIERIKTYKEINVLPVKKDFNTGEEVYKFVVDILDKEKVDGIFDITYRLHEISKALIVANKAQDVKLVGYDLFEENSSFIETSVIDAIVFQDLSGQIFQAVKLLFDELCYDKPIEKNKYYARLDIIMSENLEYFSQEYMENI